MILGQVVYKTTGSSMFFHVLSTVYRILEKSVQKHQKVQWLACMKPRTCGGEFGRRGAMLGLVRVTFGTNMYGTNLINSFEILSANIYTLYKHGDAAPTRFYKQPTLAILFDDKAQSSFGCWQLGKIMYQGISGLMQF